MTALWTEPAWPQWSQAAGVLEQELGNQILSLALAPVYCWPSLAPTPSLPKQPWCFVTHILQCKDHCDATRKNLNILDRGHRVNSLLGDLLTYVSPWGPVLQGISLWGCAAAVWMSVLDQWDQWEKRVVGNISLPNGMDVLDRDWPNNIEKFK